MDLALDALGRGHPLDLRDWQISTVKFLGFVRPGEVLTLDHSMVGSDQIRFHGRNADGVVASGTLSVARPDPSPPMTVERPSAPAPATKTAEWIGHRERGSTALLRFMAFLSLRLGRTLSRIPLYGIALYFFWLRPRPTTIPPLPAARPRPGAACRRSFPACVELRDQHP